MVTLLTNSSSNSSKNNKNRVIFYNIIKTFEFFFSNCELINETDFIYLL